MATQWQYENAHARRKLQEPCPFCGGSDAELWFDPRSNWGEAIEPFQVRCSCGAAGPWCDCGEESAVPAWLSVARKETV